MAMRPACAVPRTPSRDRPAARGGAAHTTRPAAPPLHGLVAKRPRPFARATAHATHNEAQPNLQQRRCLTFLTHGWGPERARAMTAEANLLRPLPSPPHMPKRPLPAVQHKHAHNSGDPLHCHFFDVNMLRDEARQQPRTHNTGPHIPNRWEIGTHAMGDRARAPKNPMHAPDASPKPIGHEPHTRRRRRRAPPLQ